MSIRVLLTFLQYVAAIGKNDIRELSRFDMEAFQTEPEQRYAGEKGRHNPFSSNLVLRGRVPHQECRARAAAGEAN
ncbi:hypothetical protein DVH26_19975 [Paenibacillus sp. H1-7]|nr:hypothetical protein DVH26_19975 [Paenibacillus sp. H1-7]